MRLEEELKTKGFKNELVKANLNIMFTAGLIKTMNGRFLKDFGLTTEQYNVLRILQGQHGNAICMKEINCRMIDKSSNTTRIIDKLLAKGLVTRGSSVADRREIVCSITPNGSELAVRIEAALDKAGPSLAGVSASEAQLLNALLDKIRE